ncbi:MULTISPECIES: hypothetical protein [Paenibacillus]|jgi:hypothetical protein|uniref:hypothetical protein n=1 Tax=Paenibacillus TaxID=44249 RepID=UPI0011324E6A|nr:hypothetical protein [Paenibacillus odorifer]
MDTVLSLNAVPVILPPLSEMLLVCDKQLTGNTLKLLGRIYLPKKSFFVPTIALWFLRKRTNSYYVLSITAAIVLGIP